jgi:hypothetical protein
VKRVSEFSNKSSIRENIKQHDRYQFETRFDYFLDNKHHRHFDPRKKIKFCIDVYFFIPKMMGINAESYKKSHFYEDIRALLRFKEPHLSFHQVESILGREGPFGRIELLVQHLKDLERSDRLSTKNELVDQIKYFSSVFVGRFRREIRKHCKGIKEALEIKKAKKAINYDPFEGLDSFLKEYFSLLRKFSKLREGLTQDSLSESAALEMKLAEEYCFYRFREGVALAVETLNLTESSEFETYKKMKMRLRVWSRFINWFEGHLKFLSIEENSSSSEREEFLSRLGNIKKYLSRILYLDTKQDLLFFIRSQASYMVAAALAAFWYFIANIFIFTYFQFGGFGAYQGVQSFLGIGGITVVFSFIVAYVLKDRIKEISRVRFRSGVFGKLPDYVYSIYYKSSMLSKRVYLGKMSDSVEFLRDKSNLPEEIRILRQQGELWEEKDQYDLLLYQKKIELNSYIMPKIKPIFYSIKHITRFSIRRFLTKLDDPVQIYLGLNKKGHVEEIAMPKVYYIGVATKFYSPNQPNSSGFDYQVLVVDKNGLVRIDEVAKSMRTHEP